jgi:hypothetical protein
MEETPVKLVEAVSLKVIAKYCFNIETLQLILG